MAVRVLRCTQHDIRVELGANGRTFQLPAQRGRQVNCALLVAAQMPTESTARIYITDEYGRPSALYCDVEEVE